MIIDPTSPSEGGAGTVDGTNAEHRAPTPGDQFINELKAQFPWLEQVGLDPRWFQEAAADSSGPDELLVKMRQTTQFKSRFAGLYRSDGSMRMTEAQYLAREGDYRNLLSQYGYDPNQYSTPASLVGFFDSEMDPNEFQSRLQTYADVQRSSQAKKDAFYVYAGIQLSDDDLYQAIVDPAFSQHLTNEYNRKTAAGQFDYATWITRATEVGLQRVADVLTSASKNGLVTGAAVQAVLGVDTNFARTIMDAIYTGGSGNVGTKNLSLEDLLASFEYAAYGAAASEAGLTLPTKERIAEIRQAGIERKSAADAYMAFGQNRERFSAAVQRAGYDEFTQDEFERAQFLGNAGLATQLQDGLAREEAAGKGAGEFRFSEDEGRLVQRGFGVRP